MAPRTILYTGKGGVGKTSVAAATARRCAAAGAAHARALDRPGAQPGRLARGASSAASRPQVGDSLWAQEVQAQAEMERNWSAVQDWLGELLVDRGVDRIPAEELTVPPGLDELFSPAPAQAPPRVRRLRRDRRRLRADRRDAAAAVVPRRRALVARQGLPVGAAAPGRGAAARAHDARPAAAGRARCSPRSSAWSRT